MKRTVLLCVLSLMTCVMAHAYSFTVDGFYYQILSNNEVEVTFQHQYSSDVVPDVNYYTTSYDDEDRAHYYYFQSDYSGAITIPSTVTYNGTTYKVSRIGHCAFQNCEATSITIPNTITSAGDKVFRGYTGELIINCSIEGFTESDDEDIYGPFCFGNFQSVVLGSAVTTIPAYTFYSCSINTISLFNNISDIGDLAFYDCHINNVNVNISRNSEVSANSILHRLPASATWNYYINNSLVTSLYLGYGVYTIGNYAFYNGKNIVSVSLPASLTSIGHHAFQNCSGLIAVTMRGSTPIAITSDVFTNRANATLYVPVGAKDAYAAADYWKEFKKIEELISFSDSRVKALCVQNWDTDGDGELSVSEAAAVTNLGRVFQGNSDITSFNELQYFTGLTAIGSGAFSGCYNLSSVVIPENVTSIGSSAFKECRKLPGIVIPSSVVSINDHAFYDCSKLESVIIPSSVRYIGLSAFASGYNPKNIHISDLDAWCNTSFDDYWGSQWNLYINHDKVENLVIPNGITKIASHAFSNCNLTGLDIPNSMTTISEYAFQNCEKLTSVTIPNSVTTIGKYAFAWCNALPKVVIPNSVTTIGDYAFYSCNKLMNIHIGNSVTSIGQLAFTCGSGDGIIMAVEMETPVAGHFLPGARAYGTLYVPEGCKAAYVAANEWKEFGNIVELSATSPVIEFADPAAKAACVKYYDINGDGELSEDEAAGVAYFQEGIFRNNDDITSFNELRYFTGLKEIHSNEFFSCDNLSSITLPNGLKSLLCNAFDYTNLTSIDIPSSVTRLGNYFSNSIESITVHWTTPISLNWQITNNANATLYVPYGTKAAYAAADYWKKFKTIIEMAPPSPAIEFADANVKALCVANWDSNGDGELSEAEAAAVTDLGEVFKENRDITSFDELEYFTGLTDLGSAFETCTGLRSIVIPVNVVTLDAVGNLASLESIRVVEGNTKYDSRNNCNAVIETETNKLVMGCQTTIIPEGITVIGQNAFGGRWGMREINFPASLKTIDEDAFAYCISLNNIKLPSGLESIQEGGFGVFDNCGGLKEVIVEWAEPLSIPANTFEGCDLENATLYVPYGTKAVYEAADVWKDFGTIVEVPFVGTIFTAEVNGLQMQFRVTDADEKKVETYGTYEEGPAIDPETEGEVVIPAEVNGFTVTGIGGWSFRNCQGITSVSLPTTLTYIGESAFRTCYGLTEVVIPEGVTTIGSRAFYTGNLHKVTLPSTLQEIGGDYTFTLSQDSDNIVIVNNPEPIAIPVSAFQWESMKRSVLMVPFGSREAYQAADYWKEFGEIVEMAPETEPADIAEGTYLLKNVETGKYLYAGNAWNTHTVLDDIALPVTIGKQTDGSYTFTFPVGSFNQKLLFRADETDVYVDYNDQENGCPYWTVTTSDGGESYFIQSLTTHEQYGQEALPATYLGAPLWSLLFQAWDGCQQGASVATNPEPIDDSDFGLESNFGQWLVPFSTVYGHWAVYYLWYADLTGVPSITIEGTPGLKLRMLLNRQAPEAGAEDQHGGEFVELNGTLDENGRWTVDLTGFEYVHLNAIKTDGGSPEGLVKCIKASIPTAGLRDVNGDAARCDAVTWTLETLPATRSEAQVERLQLLIAEAQQLVIETTEAEAMLSSSSATYLETAEAIRSLQQQVIDRQNMPNNLYVDEAPSVLRGSKAELNISLRNAGAVSSTDFYLQLPAGMTIVNSAVSIAADRSDNHQVSALLNEEGGYYHIVCHSGNNSVFKENDGLLFSMTIACDESVAAGSYEGQMKNILMWDSSKVESSQPDFTFSIEVPEQQLGDVNADSRINVGDIMEVVDNIMRRPSDNFNFAAANLYYDKKINVFDLVRLINLVLRQPMTSNTLSLARRLSRMMSGEASDVVSGLTIADFGINPGEQQAVDIELSNADHPYSLLEFELTLPEGVSLAKGQDGKWAVAPNSSRITSAHTITVEEIGQGQYKFLVYSTQNTAIEGSSGAIMTLTLTADADAPVGLQQGSITGQVLAEADEDGYEPADVSFSVKVGLLRGDANGDGRVSIADVVAVVDYVTTNGNPTGQFVASAADTDGVEGITIADAVAIVNMIIGE